MDRLVREYRSGDSSARREAVRQLSSSDGPRAREIIISALDDVSDPVRIEAANGCAALRLTACRAVLIDWLDEPSEDQRRAAARALAEIPSTEAIQGLIRALGDTDAAVRVAAVRALAVTNHPDAVVPLVARLEDADSSVRRAAIHALASTDDPRVTVPLIARTGDDSEEVRVDTYRALAELRDPRAFPPLTRAADEEQSVAARAAALAAIGRLGGERAVEIVGRIARTRDNRSASLAAITVLGSIEHESAPAALASLLTEPHVAGPAGSALIEAIRAGRGRDLGESLALSLETGERRTSHAVQRVALAYVETHGPAPLEPAILRQLGRLAQTTEPVGTDRAARNIEALRARAQAQIASVGVSSLMLAAAHFESEESLITLLRLLRSSAPQIRRGAMAALTQRFQTQPGDGRALDPLLDAFENASLGERAQLLDLVGRAGGPRAVPALTSALSSDTPTIKRAALRALARVGDRSAAPALLPFLDDERSEIRFEAALGLGRAADLETTRTLLTRIAEQAPLDRHAALMALGPSLRSHSADGSLDSTIQESASQLLGRIARGGDDELAARATDALAAWGDASAAQVLLALDPEAPAVRRPDVIYALGLTSAPTVLPRLRELSQSSDRALAAAAIAGIARHGGTEDLEPLMSLLSTEWPVGASASYALAQVMSREGPNPEMSTRICTLVTRGSPAMRSNALIALAATPAAQCDPTVDFTRLMSLSQPTTVRLATVQLLRARRAANSLRARERLLLSECAARDVSRQVSGACSAIAAPEDEAPQPSDEEIDIYAYSEDGQSLLRRRFVGMRFGDGTALIVRTDSNGHVRTRAPEDVATVVLFDPFAGD